MEKKNKVEQLGKEAKKGMKAMSDIDVLCLHPLSTQDHDAIFVLAVHSKIPHVDTWIPWCCNALPSFIHSRHSANHSPSRTISPQNAGNRWIRRIDMIATALASRRYFPSCTALIAHWRGVVGSVQDLM
jgi:hypothetical protein